MHEDALDDLRKYVVLCGKSHISVNDVHVFTIEEAESVRANMEAKIVAQLEELDEKKDFRRIESLEWRLATLRIEERILN